MKNRNKLQQCLRLAREASRDSWQIPGVHSATRKALRQIRREAIKDARYWRERL
jgi:hypothetical protein